MTWFNVTQYICVTDKHENVPFVIIAIPPLTICIKNNTTDANIYMIEEQELLTPSF